MSCCGNKRQGLYHTQPLAQPKSAPMETHLQRVVFEYLGSSVFSVLSPITGRRYRFEGPGARIEVAARDRPYLAGLAQLRQVV